MDNMNGTPAGGYYGTPAGTPDPSSPAPGRKKRLFRWGAGLTLAAVLAGGGVAWAATSGGSATGASAGTQSAGTQSADTQDAAVLNSALNTAGGTAAAASPARVRRALGRLRRIGGVDGEFTFHNKTGFHTVAFERGTIQSVSGSDVVVKASDGTTWSWEIVSDTVVRKAGSKTTTSALSAGESVFAGGPVVSGAKDARLIVIRAAGTAGTSGTSGTSGSDSAQASLS
jgi:hypothetical protein